MPTIDSFNLYDPTTGKYNELKVSTKFTELKNTVTLVTDSSFVDIGITNFNPLEDILDVVKNTTSINEGTGTDEYILNGGNLRIENPDGLWLSGTKFHFRVLKNVDRSPLPSYDPSLFEDGGFTKAKLAQELQNELDLIPMINTQLADTTQQANALEINKADKTEVNTLATEKATKTEVEVERQRINSFTALAVGSTTGDAELIDARIGADGITYANAGESIRGQINKLTDSITDYIYKNILDEITTYPNKYLSQYDGNVLDGNGNTTTDFIPFVNGQVMHFYDATVANALIRWSVYDSNKVLVAGDFIYLNNYEGNINYNNLTFAYLRFSYEDATVKAYYGTGPKVDKYSIKYDALPLKLLRKGNNYIVDKNGNGDYTTVTDACNNAEDGSIITILPGVYDNEVITGTWSKKLYLVGYSAKDTIIKNSKGDYNQPPIQIGSGYLKNLTFYSEKTETSPPHNGGATMEYAVHSESDNLYNGNLTIEDCILMSDYAPALGMGMRGGCHVLSKGTYFIGNYGGSILFHDSENEAYTGIQNVSFIDCVMHETANHEAIIMQSQERAGSIINLEMIRNTIITDCQYKYSVFNYRYGTGTSNDFLGLINLRLTDTSGGNNVDAFNNVSHVENKVLNGLLWEDTVIISNAYGWYGIAVIKESGKPIVITRDNDTAFTLCTTTTRPAIDVAINRKVTSANGIAKIVTDETDKFLLIGFAGQASMTEEEKLQHLKGITVTQDKLITSLVS